MNILSFDIEDWFHLLDTDTTRTEHQWSGFESRIEHNTDRILDLLHTLRCKATFFCLGWAARAHPGLIRRINALGHEIATHTDSHQLAYEQTPSLFRQDLQRSIQALEDCIGEKVRAARIPGFSVTRQTPWVFEALLDCGIEIDSSVFPARRAHGGFPEFGLARPCWISRDNAGIKEFPVNTAAILGVPMVFSGGGYFRLIPYALLRRLMNRAAYVMTYFHPRDFDPHQPIVPGLPLTRRLKSYTGLKASFEKLRRLLREFPFCDIAEAHDRINWDTAPVHALDNIRFRGPTLSGDTAP